MVGPGTLFVSCVVKNTGEIAGDEVVQVYLRDEGASLPVPRHSLVGFRRVHLAPGAEERLTFEITPRQFATVDRDGLWVIEPGVFTVFVGGGQPGTEGVLSAPINMVGETTYL
jgi:beta-glucosidase